MSRCPAGEETLVGYMRASKADGSQVVALRRDALAVTDRRILRQQPHLLDLDQGTNI
jgi:hypothetical protein